MKYSNLRGIAMSITALLAASAFCDTFIYDFSTFRNASVNNFHVPLLLKAGKKDKNNNTFSYEGAAENGSNLCIADNDKTLLAYEIEKWDPSGESIVWVKVPNFSKDTTLELSWAEDQEENPNQYTTAAEFWDDPFVVMHFGSQDGLNSGTGETFVKKALKSGGSIENTAAIIGNGASFNRTSYYELDNTKEEKFVKGSSQFTYSCWIKTDRLTMLNDQTYLLQVKYKNTAVGQDAQIGLLLNWTEDATLGLYLNNSANKAWGATTSVIPYTKDYAWHHVALTYDGAKLTAYIDGYIAFTKNYQGVVLNDWQVKGHLGVGATSEGSHPFYGELDEFRFERVCRSAEWIRASVETQCPPDSLKFVTVPFSDYTGETLYDFPAYINLDDTTGLDIGNLADALKSGNSCITDLRTGEVLPAEIEYCYDNHFHRSIGLWVRMPQYSKDDGVVINQQSIYVPAENNQTENIDPSKVWNRPSDVLVFHMNPTKRLYDAVNGINLSMKPLHGDYVEGAEAYPIATMGPTGPYQAYRSTTNAVQFQSFEIDLEQPLTNVWTLSWWAKEDEDEFAEPKKETYLMSLPTMSVIKGAGYSGQGADANTMVLYSGGKECKLTIPDAKWHYYVYAADGKKVSCYRDGIEQVSMNWSKNLTENSGTKDNPNVLKGYITLMSSKNAVKDAFRGCADEVRLESTCRSAQWIKASYQNQLAYREGVAYHFSPHLGEISNDEPEDCTVRVRTKLSCRTSASCTLFWGEEDGNTIVKKWENSRELGEFSDGEEIAGKIEIPMRGKRLAYRFRVTNQYGTYWSKAGFASAQLAPKRGAKAKITTAYDGAETLYDFPLCLRIPAANKLPADKAFVQFTDENGCTLAWEAESYDPSGESVIWVRIPEFTADSVVTMHTGRHVPGSASWPADSVWKPELNAGVWHFAPCRSTGNRVFTDDSTSFGSHIVEATDYAAYPTNGVAGKAFHFSRSQKLGNFYTANGGVPFFDFPKGFTFSYWLQLPDTENTDTQIFAKHELDEMKGLAATTHYFQLRMTYNPQTSAIYLNLYASSPTVYPLVNINTQYLIPNPDPQKKENPKSVRDVFEEYTTIKRPDDKWHHYAISHDGMFLRAYLDGELVKSKFWPFVLNGGDPVDKNMQTYFGSDINQHSMAFCSLDEYRVERVGRSAAWLKASYENQKPGSTFVNIGGPEYNGMRIVVK